METVNNGEISEKNSITLTAEQDRAINEEGNIIVSAAAGAGKTFVMTERILRNVLEGTKVDELLVVTFMKLAANEMKEKIEKKLVEKAKKETDPAQKARLLSAASGIFRANISTIDSFCSNVLRRNYHKVGLDPAFRVLDNSESIIIFSNALEETLEAFCEEATTNKDRASAFLLAAFNGTGGIGDAMKKLYDFVTSRPEPEAKLISAAERYDALFGEVFALSEKELIQRAGFIIDKNLKKANELLLPDFGLEYGALQKMRNVLNADIEYLETLKKQSTYEGFYNAIKDAEKLPAFKKGAPDEYLKYYEGFRDKDKKKIEEMFAFSPEEEKEYAKALYPAVKKLCELTLDLYVRYREKKTRATAVDFADLGQLCLVALNDEETAKEYREKFRYIFVDEFQDTNLLQDSIIGRISRGDNVFLVGDVKQSIYGFRQADPQVFIDKYNAFDGTEGTHIDLNMNFRSDSAILSATNKLFYVLMNEETGDVAYSESSELKKHGNAGRGEVELALIELSAEKYKEALKDHDAPNFDVADGMAEADDDLGNENGDDSVELEVVEAEANYIADRIMELTAQKFQVYDDSIKARRAIRYSDFAVLMRKTSGVALQMVNKFSERGIPAAAELTDGFFDAMEIQLVLNILRTVDNTQNEIPLASVLLSPVGGFTETELALIKHIFKSESGLEGFFDWFIRAANEGERLINNERTKRDLDKDSSEIAKKAARFMQRIKDWREKSRQTGLAEFVGIVIDETHIRALLSALPNGQVRQANIDMLTDKAHSFEAAGGRTLYGFLSTLDSIRKLDKLGAANQSESNAVRVLSVHKSKGLEYPVVFVCSLNSKINKKDPSNTVLIDRDLGIGLKVSNGLYLLSSGEAPLSPKHERGVIRRAMDARAMKKLMAEEMRILYVAMTRARERMYLVSAKNDMKKVVENAAKRLDPTAVLDADSFLKWMLGAYFPLGLNLKNAAGEGGITLTTAASGDEADTLTVRYLLGREDDGINNAEKKRSLADWCDMAKTADTSRLKAMFELGYLHEEDTKEDSKRSVSDFVADEKEKMNEDGSITPRAAERVYYDYIPAVPIFLRGEKRRLSAAERGTATHNFLKLMPLEKLDENGIKEELARLKERGMLGEEEAEAVSVSAVKAFMDSPLYARFIAADEREREREFSFIHSESGQLIQGCIDCYFVENGEIVLIDYKTNAAGGEDEARAIAESYAVQLKLYQEALEGLRGLKVKEKWIYMLSSSSAHKIG
ncbi:MAG: helicase-exonuclease AddAB subunit AddA [Clostridia bacterium]|nr:helicase-exonuclease AddAB subunit AddA [Clostridia bacterium]